MLEQRNWRWLRAKIVGLLDTPPIVVIGPTGPQYIPSTRLGLALEPPI